MRDGVFNTKKVTSREYFFGRLGKGLQKQPDTLEAHNRRIVQWTELRYDFQSDG